MAEGGATELDAGLNEAGNASATICNPITNSGCTGTDVCGPDNSGSFWVCTPGGSPDVALCGDCSSQTAVCAAGNICIGYQAPDGGAGPTECVHYCCTDADCGGASGSCNTSGLQPPLPNSVGICSM
jgi:hypothetical protein